jgi:hypothetical protein
VSTPLTGPTKEQKAMLRAVPSASFSAGKRAGGRKKSKAVGSSYNPQAGRPFPRLTTPEQSIVTTLETSASFTTTSLTVATFAAAAITLTQFPGYNEFIGLFDQYKFLDVEAWVEPTILGSSTLADAPYYTAVDLDDATAPSATQSVSTKGGAIVTGTMCGHYHRWQPHMATAVYSGAFTSFANQPADWIDSASPAVQHYGLKFASGLPDALARPFLLTLRARVAFRAPGI